MITVECDGVDITPKLKEHRVHSVLFANIPSFGSGKLTYKITLRRSVLCEKNQLLSNIFFPGKRSSILAKPFEDQFSAKRNITIFRE